MTRITSADEIQQLVNTLRDRKFYGEVRIAFRAGKLTKLVTEAVQVFTEERQEKGLHNAHYANNR